MSSGALALLQLFGCNTKSRALKLDFDDGAVVPFECMWMLLASQRVLSLGAVVLPLTLFGCV